MIPSTDLPFSSGKSGFFTDLSGFGERHDFGVGLRVSGLGLLVTSPTMSSIFQPPNEDFPIFVLETQSFQKTDQFTNAKSDIPIQKLV
jgi:hypothetical protein